MTGISYHKSWIFHKELSRSPDRDVSITSPYLACALDLRISRSFSIVDSKRFLFCSIERVSAIHSFSGKRETGHRSHECFHPCHSAKSSLWSACSGHCHGEDKNEHSGEFLGCKVFNSLSLSLSLNVSFDLSKKKKARQPCQFKYIVNYNTTDSAIWVMAAK